MGYLRDRSAAEFYKGLNNDGDDDGADPIHQPIDLGCIAISYVRPCNGGDN